MDQPEKPRIVVFASGEAEGGGSGFETLIHFSRTNPPVLEADVVGVVSNHPAGGVRKRADKFGVPFHFFQKPYSADNYQRVMDFFDAEWAMLSGWLLFVRGLETDRTINIHPGPLPEFGGSGMHGHHVHEAVIAAYQVGEIGQSAVSMHFVDSNYPYDTGPIFFELPVAITPDDTPDTLAARVNKFEHGWQAFILNLVVHGAIYLEEDSTSWTLRSPLGIVIPGWNKKRIKKVEKPTRQS